MRAGRGGAPSHGPAVEICGLGTRPSQDATLEVLEVLGGCDKVYAELAGEASFDWLRGLCPSLKRPSAAAELVAAARQGERAGLAVWGHPLFSSPLARELLRQAAAAGVPCRVRASTSPAGNVLARSLNFFGGAFGWQGLQACELGTALAGPKPFAAQLPSIVYAENGSAADWGRLGALAAKAFPPGHRAVVYFFERDEPLELRVDALAGRIAGGAALWLPPRRAGKLK